MVKFWLESDYISHRFLPLTDPFDKRHSCRGIRIDKTQCDNPDICPYIFFCTNLLELETSFCETTLLVEGYLMSMHPLPPLTIQEGFNRVNSAMLLT